LNVGPLDFEDEVPLVLDFDLEELATGTLAFDEGVVGV
jgi:hypothetical protein